MALDQPEGPDPKFPPIAMYPPSVATTFSRDHGVMSSSSTNAHVLPSADVSATPRNPNAPVSPTITNPLAPPAAP